MSIARTLSNWWSRWITGAYGADRLLEVLRARYADERQHAARFTLHAHKMHYPQFREALLRIAADESKHAERIAEKINELGGSLPPEPEVFPSLGNGWRYLLDDLEEERRCAAELESARLTVASDYPEISELLEHIDEDERKHRDEIRGMLMRSDPQALWAP
jgi:rubrerythrin